MSSVTNPEDLHTFEHHWPIIQSVLRSLISYDPINKEEWQDLFHYIHLVCSWDERGCIKLLEALEIELLNSFVIKQKQRLIDSEQKLKEYIYCWSEFAELSQRLPVAFQQLDSASKQLKCQKQLKLEKTYSCESTVRNLMFKLWDQHILDVLAQSLQDNAIRLISDERNGLIIDSYLITNLRESLVCIDKYNEMLYERIKAYKQKGTYQITSYNPYMIRFKSVYIQDIEIFYTSKAIATFSEKGLMQYIRWALEKIDIEHCNAELYLGSVSSATVSQVIETCTNVLVMRFAEEVLTESSEYFQSGATKNENIKLIFVFLSRAGSPFVEIFLDLWSEHILKPNIACPIPTAPFNSNECKQYVDMLIESYLLFQQVVNYSLCDDVRAKQVLDEAFQIIVNGRTKADSHNENRCAELLAFYCDLLLRRTPTSRKFTSDEITESLRKALLVIKFLKDKDSFIKFHKVHLTRRLLLNTTLGIDKEEQFVGLLDKLCGSDHTNEISRMFKDFRVSMELKEQYKKTLENDISQENISNINNNNNNNNDNSIQVLTTKIQSDLNPQNPSKDLDTVDIKILNPDVWPKTKDKNVTYKNPKQSDAIITNYETFYRNKYLGRKLEWCPQFSTGTLTFTTKKGKFDLEVTLAQYSVLTSFNSISTGSKSFNDLELETKLSQNELRRTLWSLMANPRLREQLLICYPGIRSINDIDKKVNKFTINHNFMLSKNGEQKSYGSVSLIGRLFI